jgi:hypothetical protein
MAKETDFGTQGAKVQSWHKNNARELLARIVSENPNLDDEGIYHAFADKCAPYFVEICRYWVANNLKALRPRSRGAPVDRIAAVEGRARARLLDFILPNGKMLRDSTFGECAKAGGWLTKLSKLGQPGEKIGSVLTEKQVKAALKE